jgi:hypothetical protein
MTTKNSKLKKLNQKMNFLFFSYIYYKEFAKISNLIKIIILNLFKKIIWIKEKEEQKKIF